MSQESAYRQAGVDIDAQDQAIARIKPLVHATRTDGVLGDVGCFGGLFRPPWTSARDPVLVASADGVGTKLKIAIRLGDYTTIGRDLVNHCVNDVLVQGARPLFFLDYIAQGRLEPSVVEGVVSGLSAACREAGCALLGGEMAEMPGLYRAGDFDVAGFIVGLVDREAILPRDTIREGDVIYGLPSNGLHTNGYSLAIKILLEDRALPLDAPLEGVDGTVGSALMAVHTSYLPRLRPLLHEPWLKGLAHITGGGLVDNLPRILPPGVSARIQAGSWPVPALFRHLVQLGGVSVDEAFRVFNLGVGMAVVVEAAQATAFESALAKNGGIAHRIGDIVQGDGIMKLEGADASLFTL